MTSASAPRAANATRSAQRVVAAAEELAWVLMDRGLVERIDHSLPEGKALITLLDSVFELEAHTAGMYDRRSPRVPPG